MTSSSYAYMLRICLPPGHLEERRLNDLARFCREGRVEDVMFFINAEELNNGHLTVEETRPWLETIDSAKKSLAPYGVTASINPWITLLHSARGRQLKERHRFRLMVDPYGNQSTAVVCPTCPEWQQYITEMYAFYASIKPAVLWVEDDFRFHNHDPLQWGGCFCDEHMREFARKAGVASLDRETFKRGLLQPGDPHQFRRIWLDSCRDTLVELARKISDAVHEVSPDTRIGLMTSSPSVHAAEGRDWHSIMTAFDGEGGNTAIIRTHLPAYTEEAGYKYWWMFNGISRFTAALIPEHTEAYPEFENYPFSRYSKSIAFQKFQLETSLIIGSRGITLDIFDMMGNGIYPQEYYERWLNDEKDYLNAIVALHLHVKDQTGIHVVVNERSSYSLHTAQGERMEELYPNETLWASYLSAFGIANRFTTGLPEDNGIVAVSGQAFRNMGEAAIRDLFDNHTVLLEGEAVHTLCEMGLGMLCGVMRAVWHHYESGFQSYEEITNNREYVGIGSGRMTAQISIGNYLEIEYSDRTKAEVIGHVHNGQGHAAGPGMTLVNDRVFILPYGQLGDAGYQGLLSPIRRAVIQESLQKLSEQPPLMITSYAPHVSVYRFNAAGGETLAIVNASADHVDELSLTDIGMELEGWTEYSRADPSGRPVTIRQDQNGLVFDSDLPALSMKIYHKRSQG
ncbi:hypothetical protein [Paenibacillus mendelii]|uniref:Beta-galactosidase trimerisation domain-containing protein n=1 Tax=Paenibacillus mendelii TaxID=206163 RepID=A0ABV6JFS6_9BACL|nr:hypothetical protein [Paenibacillus mendelii]MCQ6557647.1 hypothetical protein [Paenibacillus mendelii]